MSALAEVAAAAEPAIAAHAVADPPPGRWERDLDGHRAAVVEAVYEAFLLHYREPRAFAGMDDDLRLLAGDALYAQGLERLALAGDLEAVAELAALISACARAEGEGRPEEADRHWHASVARLAQSPSNPA